MIPLGIVKVQIALVFISMVLNLYFMQGPIIDDCLLLWVKGIKNIDYDCQGCLC